MSNSYRNDLVSSLLDFRNKFLNEWGMRGALWARVNNLLVRLLTDSGLEIKSLTVKDLLGVEELACYQLTAAGCECDDEVSVYQRNQGKNIDPDRLMDKKLIDLNRIVFPGLIAVLELPKYSKQGPAPSLSNYRESAIRSLEEYYTIFEGRCAHSSEPIMKGIRAWGKKLADLSIDIGTITLGDFFDPEDFSTNNLYQPTPGLITVGFGFEEFTDPDNLSSTKLIDVTSILFAQGVAALLPYDYTIRLPKYMKD